MATTKKRVARKRTKTAKKKVTRRKKGKTRKTSASQSSLATPASPERKKHARSVLRELHELYPDANCALRHEDAFELLIATIMSAQSTDVNVNKVTPVLFGEYPTPADLAAADPDEVEIIIKSTGFFRQKRKNIQGAAKRIVEEFGGKVPRTIDELTQLPGVARKTANVVLGTWFHQNDGVVVDTHVGRLAHRLDLTWTSKGTKDAVKIERDLMEVIPRDDWTYLSHALIWHGRELCKARSPLCDRCPLARLCPAAETKG